MLWIKLIYTLFSVSFLFYGYFTFGNEPEVLLSFLEGESSIGKLTQQVPENNGKPQWVITYSKGTVSVSETVARKLIKISQTYPPGKPVGTPRTTGGIMQAEVEQPELFVDSKIGELASIQSFPTIKLRVKVRDFQREATYGFAKKNRQGEYQYTDWHRSTELRFITEPPSIVLSAQQAQNFLLDFGAEEKTGAPRKQTVPIILLPDPKASTTAEQTLDLWTFLHPTSKETMVRFITYKDWEQFKKTGNLDPDCILAAELKMIRVANPREPTEWQEQLDYYKKRQAQEEAKAQTQGGRFDKNSLNILATGFKTQADSKEDSAINPALLLKAALSKIKIEEPSNTPPKKNIAESDKTAIIPNTPEKNGEQKPSTPTPHHGFFRRCLNSLLQGFLNN